MDVMLVGSTLLNKQVKGKAVTKQNSHAANKGGESSEMWTEVEQL